MKYFVLLMHRLQDFALQVFVNFFILVVYKTLLKYLLGTFAGTPEFTNTYSVSLLIYFSLRVEDNNYFFILLFTGLNFKTVLL